MSSTSHPIACDITRLDGESRAREQELLARFRSIFASPIQTGAGYRVNVPSDRATLAELGELLALERLCCPFLRFHLSVDAAEIAGLDIEGPDGSHEFIARTFFA